MADTRPEYQSGVGVINGTQFHWGSGDPGKYWSIPYGDYPVTPNAPTGAWAHSVGAIPINNNVIPDPVLHRNRVGIMIHPSSSDHLDQLYTQGCFAVAPQEWPAVRQQILDEASKGPLYLHVAPGGVAAFTNTKTLSQAGTPPADQSGPSTSSAAPSQGTTLNNSAVIDTLGKNIAGIESGGQQNPYMALNPTTHAVGKYQVMPNNIPGWTMAATGTQMTPDEFRNNPQAQEAVFHDQMQRSLQLYSPADAASIWFTGKPFKLAGGNVTDANGTTNASYVTRATAGIPNPGTTINTTGPSTATAATTTAKPTGFGGFVSAMTSPTAPTTPGGAPGPSPIEQLEKTAGGGQKTDQGGGEEQQPASAGAGPQQDLAAGMGNPRQQMLQQQAQQMWAMLQQGQHPLTWGSAPPGSGPIPAGFQPQPPGVTLNSMGG